MKKKLTSVILLLTVAVVCVLCVTACKKKDLDDKDKHVHEYSEEWTIDTVATCTSEGSKSRHCKSCNDKTDVTIIEKIEHNYVNGVCAACGDVKQEIIEEATGLEYELSEDETYYIVGGIGTEKRTEFKIPATYNNKPVQEIGNGAFSNCSSLKSITIPDSVTTIDYYAFKDCSGLQSITIPDSVTIIGVGAFQNCSSLQSITIPDSVISIGGSEIAAPTFCGCSGLQSINVSKGNAKYCSTNNCLIEIESKTLILGCKNSVIPKDGKVTSIARLAFFGCSGLQNITIPDCVTSIGYSAFLGCSGLTSITIPDSVTSIGPSTFGDCSSLRSVTIGSGVAEIGNYMSPAFNRCFKLVEVINKSSLNITKGSKDNGYVAYYALNVKTEGTSDMVNINDYLFYTYDNVNYLLGYVGNETELVLPNNYIGENYVINQFAFEDCISLTSVTIPDSVTSIGDYAFRGCSSLTSVTIGNGVTSIGDYAFEYCNSLTSVTIGNGVTSIGDYAFSGCVKLVEVINKSNLDIVKGSFDNGQVARYSLNVKTEGVSDIVNVNDYLFITDENNVNYLLCYVGNETELVLPNNYIGENYVINQFAFEDCISLTSITIPDIVTSIGAGVFGGCSSLTSVTIGKGVVSIDGDFAFYDCRSLKGVYITDIEAWCNIEFAVADANPLAYAGDLYLNNKLVTDLVIPDTINTIKDRAFIGATCLQSVTIGNGVTSIGDSAFRGCSSLTSITIPDSVTSIGDYAFGYCNSLTNVTIGNGVTSIGDYAFRGCSSLTSITIPDSVTSIGDYAFYDCSSLTSVTIPDSVTSIGDYAFRGCSSLSRIDFNGTKEQWNAISKDTDWKDSTGKSTVYCTDGEISKSDA